MDIYKEEKFDKGGIVLERIHPDLQVEPYVPYYEKMGYVVSIVEKPNGWVELIGEKGVLPFDSEAQGYDKEGKPYGYDNLPFEDGGKIKELETDEFTYYVDEDGENVEMYRNSDNSLVSDNYFAENDLYERMQEIANGREKYVYINPDSLEYLDEYKYAKGGRTSIENDGVDFNEEMYRGILGDRDKDGTENADDVEPNNPNVSENIEGTKFTDTFRTLLGNKRTYDDSMYSIIGEMEKILPQKFDIIARTKTPFSILKKLVEKRLKFKRNEEGKVTNKGLTDVVGTTIATNNTKELMTLRKMIGVDNGDNGIFGEVIEVDDKFKIPACGYRAIHYIVLYNGVPVEIQLKTKRMKMLNEFTHPFYKAKDLDCDGMGELAEIVVMADNGSKEAQKEFADIFADKDRMRSMISKSYARGGEVTTYGGVSGRLNVPQLSFTKVDYDVNVNPSNLEVDVNIKESDSVDHYALNDSDAKWTQYSWGYMVYPKNEKQLYDVLKALRVSVSKQRLSDWFKSGGKSYAKGGEVKPRKGRKFDIGNRDKKVKVDTIYGDRAMTIVYFDRKGNVDKEKVVSFERGLREINDNIGYDVPYVNNTKDNKISYIFYRNIDVFERDKHNLKNRKSLIYETKLMAKGGEVEWFDYSKIDLEELPYDLDRYFIKDADTKEIDLNLLEPTRAREKGVKNANKYMRMAYDGEIDRRKPISVYERNGEMFVFDGNSTIANAKNSGWKTIYVEMIDDPNDDFERGGKLEPSFEIVDYLKNHTKNEAYRFNNHNRRSRFITDKQYEVNRQYIKGYVSSGLKTVEVYVNDEDENPIKVFNSLSKARKWVDENKKKYEHIYITYFLNKGFTKTDFSSISIDWYDSIADVDELFRELQGLVD